MSITPPPSLPTLPGQRSILPRPYDHDPLEFPLHALQIAPLANTTAALVGRGVGDSSSVACAVGGDGASTTSEEFAQAGAAPATPDGRPAGEPRCTPVHLLHCSPDLASPPPNSIGYLLHPLCKFH